MGRFTNRPDLERAERMLENSRGVDPSTHKIESNSTIETNTEDSSTPRKLGIAQNVLGNKEKSTFNQSFDSSVKDTNVNTGEVTNIVTHESSTPRNFNLAQKVLGNKNIFTEHADTIDADGNLIVESDRQIKNFGFGRNKENVKYHDKQAELDAKAMEKLYKKNPELFNYDSSNPIEG